MSLIQESGWRNTEPISTPGIEQVEIGSCRGEPQTSGVGKGPHDPNLKIVRVAKTYFIFPMTPKYTDTVLMQ